MARGKLRLYLGAAPGVGKTYAMLNEGRRRHDRGTDVVVGFVETHGRSRTAEQIGDLEVVSRRRIEYRGAEFEEMDVYAVIARHAELALLWLADRVDEGLENYRERHNITEPWETRERVLVAITGAPGTEALIRRAARMAQRSHGELLGVHVRNDDGLAGGGRSDAVERYRQLLTDLGGEYHEVVASDVAAALAELARVEN